MNPLQHILNIAILNSELLKHNVNYKEISKEFIIQIPADSKIENFEKYNGTILYDSKELAGIAGMFNHMIKEGIQIIYSNDLGAQIRGIDAIGKKENRNIICEAKGTVLKNSNASSHLKKTKTKGRQLSWNWIWASIVDFAEDVRNANVFIKIYEQVIQNRDIERRLYITRLAKLKNKYRILSTECYLEKDLEHLNEFNEFSAKEKLCLWLNQIKQANNGSKKN